MINPFLQLGCSVWLNPSVASTGQNKQSTHGLDHSTMAPWHNDSEIVTLVPRWPQPRCECRTWDCERQRMTTCISKAPGNWENRIMSNRFDSFESWCLILKSLTFKDVEPCWHLSSVPSQQLLHFQQSELPTSSAPCWWFVDSLSLEQIPLLPPFGEVYVRWNASKERLRAAVGLMVEYCGGDG